MHTCIHNVHAYAYYIYIYTETKERQRKTKENQRTAKENLKKPEGVKGCAGAADDPVCPTYALLTRCLRAVTRRQAAPRHQAGPRTSGKPQGCIFLCPCFGGSKYTSSSPTLKSWSNNSAYLRSKNSRYNICHGAFKVKRGV